MSKMKRKILLITTKGCEACKIMDRIIQRALDDFDKLVEYEIKDKDNVDIEFLKEHHIDDFPTVVFYQGDSMVFMTSGTKPAAVMKTYMNIHFD